MLVSSAKNLAQFKCTYYKVLTNGSRTQWKEMPVDYTTNLRTSNLQQLELLKIW